MPVEQVLSAVGAMLAREEFNPATAAMSFRVAASDFLMQTLRGASDNRRREIWRNVASEGAHLLRGAGHGHVGEAG